MADDVVAVALEAWNAVTQAPEGIDEPPTEVEAVVAEATTDNGTARACLEEKYLYYDDRIAFRGDVVGEPLGPATVDGPVATVSACLSVSAENTADSEVEVSLSDSYIQHELVADVSGAPPVLVEVTQLVRPGWPYLR